MDLRRHIQRRHTAEAAVTAEQPGRWGQLQRYKPESQIVWSPTAHVAYCFGCFHWLTHQSSPGIVHAMRDHVCLEKKSRGPRDAVAAESRVQEVEMATVFDQCMIAVTKMRVPAERLELRNKIRTLLRNCQAEATDEETGKVDWSALFVDFTSSLAQEYVWSMPLAAAAAPIPLAPPPQPVEAPKVTAPVRPAHREGLKSGFKLLETPGLGR
jgi:hypothetical protein